MSDRQISPEHEAAAAAFNARREQDAVNWNNGAHGVKNESDSMLDSGYHPRANVSDVEIERNLNELDQQEKTPSNIVEIRPGVMQESQSASTENGQAESKSVEQEVGEVIAAETLHPFEEVQKLNEYMDKLVGDPNTFQQNTIEVVKFLATPGLSANTKESLSSILLQELQNPNRPVDIESVNDYLAALATFKNEESSLWQSTLVAEGTRVVQEKYQHVKKSRTATAPAAVVNANPSAPIKTAYEIAEEKTGGPIKQAEADAATRVQPETTTAAQATETPKSEAATNPVQTENVKTQEQLVAEREAAAEQQRKLNDKIAEVQNAWNMAPSEVRNGNSIDLRPLVNLNGNVREFANVLRQDIQEGNRQYGYLKVGGEQDDAARFEKLMEELNRFKHQIERETLRGPQLSKELAEVDKLLETNLANFDAKFQGLSPKAKELSRLDPHIQKRRASLKKKPSLFEKWFKGQ